ncbi:hypothetical protein SAMN06264365_13348 [Actinoplanes regularis]|uniref:Uncharacterized protein n=1 Tax=Actinoplanes regularis TaxID=52697 RepID=A0A239J8M0_9ACTN|nr:hypothetical protein Are01nite_81410 [Actinoplanes regularis]SNT02180.1 hypothetical protein SAMN06264365_13348 [Actinoplanes regularis]
MIAWVLVILLSSALCAVVIYYTWRSRGGSSLQALTACGSAATAVFGMGVALLNLFL